MTRMADRFTLWGRAKPEHKWGVVGRLVMAFDTWDEGEVVAARYRKCHPTQEFVVSRDAPT